VIKKPEWLRKTSVVRKSPKKKKQKRERAVNKCDERDEKRNSDDEIKMLWKTAGFRVRFRYRIIRNKKM
jgi:hypothetical protein